MPRFWFCSKANAPECAGAPGEKPGALSRVLSGMILLLLSASAFFLPSCNDVGEKTTDERPAVAAADTGSKSEPAISFPAPAAKLVFTNGTNGALYSCECSDDRGDLARRPAAIATAKKDGVPVHLFESGFIRISPYILAEKGDLLKSAVLRESEYLSILASLGYEALLPSEADLGYPEDVLGEIHKANGIPLVVTNWGNPPKSLGVRKSIVAGQSPYRFLILNVVSRTPGAGAAAVQGKYKGVISPIDSTLKKSMFEAESAAVKREIQRMRGVFDYAIVLAGPGLSDAEARALDTLPDVLLVLGGPAEPAVQGAASESATAFRHMHEAGRSIWSIGTGGKAFARIPTPDGKLLSVLNFAPGESGQLDRMWATEVDVSRTLAADYAIMADIEKTKKITIELDRMGFEKLNAGKTGREAIVRARSAYTGNVACFDCHKDIAAFWRTTMHAQAFNTLSKKGEEGNADCLPCHVVGLGNGGYAPFASSSEPFEDVGCESCHGPGQKHVSQMKIGAGKPGETDPLWLPSPGAEVCVQCHDGGHDTTFDFTNDAGIVGCPKGKGESKPS